MTTTRISPRHHSRRHVVIASTLVALAVLSPFAAASDAARTPPATVGADHRVLRFEVRFSPFDIVDVEPAAEFDGDYRAGDYVTFSDALFDRSGERVGVEAGSGLITKISPSGIQIAYTMTLRLPHGQLTAQGLGSTSPTKRLAITGGTRRYVGADGSLDLVEHGDETGSVVITLER